MYSGNGLASRDSWSLRARRLVVAGMLTALLVGGIALVPRVAVTAPPGQDGPWTTFAPMLQPRSESAVTELNGKIYVIGGYPQGRIPSNVVQVYDPATDSWSYGPPFPVPLHHTMAAVVDGTLYVIGGEFEGAGTGRPSQYLDSVYMLDEAADEWVPRAPMPTARSAGGAAVIAGKIYVAGGRPPRGHDFAVYDPAADAWTVLPDLPTARNHLAVGAIDGKVYVAGGRFGPDFNSELTAVLEIYDPATNTWMQGPSMLEPRSGMSSIVANGCLWAMGGERDRTTDSGVFPHTEAFDPRTSTWQRFTPMPTPTHGQIGAAFLNGRIHIPGGAVTMGGDTGSTLHQAYTPELSCR